MRQLSLLLPALVLVGCSSFSATAPFAERQQWRVTGIDSGQVVETVVGTGWLWQSQSKTSSGGEVLPGSETIYSNQNVWWGVLSTLFNPKSSPVLMLTPAKHQGMVMWSAGRAGDFYNCIFNFPARGKVLSGQLIKHVQVTDIPVGECSLSLIAGN